MGKELTTDIFIKRCVDVRIPYYEYKNIHKILENEI
jgi:hypothetical protein